MLKKHNYYTPANSFSSIFFSDALCLFIVVCNFFLVCIDSTNEFFLCYSNVGNVFSFVLKYLNAHHVNTHKMQCILYLLLSKTLSFSFFTCIQPYFAAFMNISNSNDCFLSPMKLKKTTNNPIIISQWLEGFSRLFWLVFLCEIAIN